MTDGHRGNRVGERKLSPAQIQKYKHKQEQKSP